MNFTPFGLSPFLLKTLERVIDVYIPSFLNPEALSEPAIDSKISIIEKSLNYKEYALAAFLNLEGAFNNTKTAFLGINIYIYSCI